MCLYLCVCMCSYACVFISIALCVQVPPNGALECKVDGVARTTVVTITTPVLMTDESGAVTLTYDAEIVRMVRGGPTALNMTAPAEAVIEEEVVVCDDEYAVSLFIDTVTSSSKDCPSPMAPADLPRIVCSASNLGGTTGEATCAPGFQLLGSCPPFFCEKE